MNVCIWTSTINRTMPEVRTKWVRLINKERITNTHLKSERSELDFKWRCVYILRANKNLCWQRRNFCDRNEVILATETLRNWSRIATFNTPTQWGTLTTPRASWNLSNASQGRALVRMSATIWLVEIYCMSQTSFGHISINSSSILTVSMATKSPWKDLSIDTSHVSRRSIMAEILGRSTGNHHSTIY